MSAGVFHDAVRRRIYVIGGQGSIDVIAQQDPFIPAWNEPFVAISQRLPAAPRT